MFTEIYYLSGTGNSLYVARELQKRLPHAELVPIARLKDEPVIKASVDVIGFVFPIHFMTAPSIVMDTIKRLDLSSACYVFAIATRQGTPCKLMFEKIDKILKDKGKSLNSSMALNMASNDPKFKDWHQCTPEQLDALEAQVNLSLDKFATIVSNMEEHHEEDSTVTFPVSPMMERIGLLAIGITGDGKEEFYCDSRCTGCGTCERVCLSSKIKLINGKPQWQKNKRCYSCYACINYCPVKAIQIKSGPLIKFYTEINGRYSHPYASADDIASQK